MFEGDEELIGSIQYRTELFDASTIKRMITHFSILCESIVHSPAQHLAELRLLDDTEAAGYTPLDFPEAHLTQKDFESLLWEINKEPA